MHIVLTKYAFFSRKIISKQTASGINTTSLLHCITKPMTSKQLDESKTIILNFINKTSVFFNDRVKKEKLFAIGLYQKNTRLLY